MSFQRFCDYTTLHGFKDYYDAKKIWKFFWAFIVVASFVMTCYEIYQVIFGYLDSPNITIIRYKTMDDYKFPNVVVCPSKWVNGTKLKMLIDDKILSKESLLFAASFLFPRTLPKEDAVNETFNRAASDEFYAYLQRRNQTVIEFFISLMIDHQNVIQYNSTMPPAVAQFQAPPNYTSRYGGMKSFCFVLTFEYVKRNILLFSPYSFQLRLVEPSYNKTDGLISAFTDPSTMFPAVDIAAGENAQTTSNSIKMKPNVTYSMYIQASHTKLLPTERRPCLTGEDLLKYAPKQYSQYYCELDCIEQALTEEKILPCHILTMSSLARDSRPGRPPVCTVDQAAVALQSKPIMQRLMNGRANACYSSCPPLCEQWRFNYLMYTEPMAPMDVGRFHNVLDFNYSPLDGIVDTEEVETYTWDTFVSNIGGQFGLWMGGSVVSIIQVIYFMILAVVEKSISRKLKLNVTDKKIQKISISSVHLY